MAITKIQTVTVGSGGAASIDFTSIPSTYTDLMCVVSVKLSGSDLGVFYKFNNSTSSINGRNLLGVGTGSGISQAVNVLQLGTVRGTTNFSNASIYVPNYTGAIKKNSFVDWVSENNETNSYQFLVSNLWSITDAINQLTIYPESGTIQEYSSATLYGVLKGSSGGVTVS